MIQMKNTHRRNLQLPILIATGLILSGCAIRKDLNSRAPVPVIGQSNSQAKPGDCNYQAVPGCKVYCAQNAKGQYPVTNILGDTGTNSDGSSWAEGGGCILRPIREVWAALNSYAAMKVIAAKSYSVDHPRLSLGPTITNFYEITNHYSELGGLINFHETMRWFHGLFSGTFENPNAVEIVFERTNGGAQVSIWNGYITLAKINDSTTSLFIHTNMRTLESEDDILHAEAYGVEMLSKARTLPPDWDNLNNHK